MNRTGQVYSVKIEKISKGGYGVARVDGFVLFVPFSAPGDDLKVKVSSDKKTYAFADIQEIVNPGPGRIQPSCPLYNQCGGCNLQHLSYPAQLEQKELIVKEQLKYVLRPETEFLPIIRSPNEWRYRNRIQLKYKRPHLGFYQRGTHEIIPITDCPIVESEICNSLPELKESLVKAKVEVLERYEVFISQNGSITTSQSKDRYMNAAFAQVNRFVNQLLVDKVLEWSTGYEYEQIFDLYAGSGNFTFPLSKRFPKTNVVGVELSEESVVTALDICRKQNIGSKKVQFYAADVGLFLKRILPKERSLVILDPPRAGCSPEVIRAIANWQKTRVLYVSCDPVSLSRDLQLFLDINPNWQIKRVQPFDMFPQTDHVETLVELEQCLELNQEL